MDIYFSRFEIRVFWGDAQISRGETYFSPREIARFRYVDAVSCTLYSDEARPLRRIGLSLDIGKLEITKLKLYTGGGHAYG